MGRLCNCSIRPPADMAFMPQGMVAWLPCMPTPPMTMFAGPSAASSVMVENWPMKSEVHQTSSGSDSTRAVRGRVKMAMRWRRRSSSGTLPKKASSSS